MEDPVLRLPTLKLRRGQGSFPAPRLAALRRPAIGRLAAAISVLPGETEIDRRTQKLHFASANRRSLSPKSSVGGRSPFVKTSRPPVTESASLA